MLFGGEMPSNELIEQVQKRLNENDIRPLTDNVSVAAPEMIEFDIQATYYIQNDKTATLGEIKREVKLATENYILWQTSKMGRDINPSYFSAMLMESRIKRVEITTPVFKQIPKGSVAVIRNCNVTFGGMEDE